MPNAKVLAEKQQLVSEVADKLRSSACTVVADYRGLTVAQATELRKALREAKLHTSWLNPYEEYDQAAASFIRAILAEPQSEFVRDLDALARSIADAGFVNSLAQTLVKISAPGIPDFYQGTELWDFNLVDPDNRRPVDFKTRCEALRAIKSRAKTNLAEASRSSLIAACSWYGPGWLRRRRARTTAWPSTILAWSQRA